MQASQSSQDSTGLSREGLGRCSRGREPKRWEDMVQRYSGRQGAGGRGQRAGGGRRQGRKGQEAHNLRELK